MSDFLFDMTYLIDLLRDDPRPEDYLSDLPVDTGLHTHAMVKAEVMVGLQNAGELGKFDRLFRQFELDLPDEEDAANALANLRKFHLSHKVGFPDRLIAATCIRLGLPVVTSNDRHFKLFKGLKVIRPH